MQNIIVVNYFYNEHPLLISLLQYMGNHMSDRVHLKCIELLYGWSQVLSHEPKIKEAYQMLKRQGIIKYDPVHIDKVGLIPSVSLCLHILQVEKRGELYYILLLTVKVTVTENHCWFLKKCENVTVLSVL